MKQREFTTVYRYGMDAEILNVRDYVYALSIETMIYFNDICDLITHYSTVHEVLTEFVSGNALPPLNGIDNEVVSRSVGYEVIKTNIESKKTGYAMIALNINDKFESSDIHDALNKFGTMINQICEDFGLEHAV